MRRYTSLKFSLSEIAVILIAIVLLAFIIGMTGCSTPAPFVTVTCLPMRDYTADQEKALAEAVASLPPASPLVGFVADYGAIRAADRACLASHPGTID